MSPVVRTTLGAVAALCTALSTLTLASSPGHADDPVVEITGGSQGIAIARDDPTGEYWLKLPGQNAEADAPATLRLGNDRRRLLLDYDSFSWVGPGDEVGWITALSSEGADPLSLTFSSMALEGQLDAAAPQVDLELAGFEGPGDFQLYESDRPRGGNSQTVPPNTRSDSFRLGTGSQRDGTPQALSAHQAVPGNVSNLVQRFAEPGMYCLTFGATYTMTGQPTPETVSSTLRVAVGDSVPADASCGTAATEPEWTRPYVGEFADGGASISANTDSNNGRDFLGLPGMTFQYWDSPSTLRLRNDQRSALPANESYAWVGQPGQVAWQTHAGGIAQGLHLQFDAGLSGALLDNLLHVELQDVVGPGDYQTYLTDRPGEPTAIVPPREDSPFMVGTGERRDGGAQDHAGSLLIDYGTGRHNFNVHRFTEPGMYCITYDVAFTVVRDGEQIPKTVSDTLRVAVGDSVPVDVPCGTASEEPPYTGPDDPDPDGPTIIRAGHGDLIYPEVDEAETGAELALRAHHDDYGNLDWDDLVVSIPDVQKITLPNTYISTADYSFIGPAGSTVWNSPESNAQSGPWIGMATQSPSLLPLGRDHRFSIRLDAVTGPDGAAAPGQVALWLGSSAASAAGGILWSTRKGLPDSHSYLNNQHTHFNWSFTHSGVYCLAFAVVTDLPDGGRQETKEQLTLAVGSDIDPATVTPCGQSSDYPTPALRETLTPTGDAPHVVTGASANLTADLDESAPGSPGLAATLDLDDTYGSGPAARHAIDEVILHSEAGYRAQPYQIFQRSLRQHGINLAWNTVDIPADGIDGDVEWELTDVRGPGDITVDLDGQEVDSTGDDNTLSFPSRTKSGAGRWSVTRPGKYCVDMTWQATTASGATVTDTHTLTVVADGPLDPEDGRPGNGPGGRTWVYDGPMFEHRPDTLTRTCADGGQPTTPEEVPLPGGGDPDPEPGDEPWDVPNGSQTASGATILNDGHVDIASLLDGALDTKVKDDTAGGLPVYWDTEATLLQLLPNSATQVPAGEQYGFLGTVGAPLWQVNQTQQASLLWPGWSTESISEDATTGGVDWKLDAVNGPGEFFLYQTSGFGAVQPVLSSTDLGASYTIPKKTHAHGNWAFTQQGVYCLGMTRSATLTAGDTPVSDAFTLAVVVGETDPRPVDPTACVGSPAPDPDPDPDPEPVVPDAPAAPTAVADRLSVTVSWTAPDDGGAAISGYTVVLTPTAGDGSPLTRQAAAGARSVRFTEVPAGEWTATVTATNAVGSSPASGASEPVAVEAPDPVPVATEVTAAAVKQVYGKTADLEVSVHPVATGVVEVNIGAWTVTAELTDGGATLKLPARQLAPGDHFLDVRYLGIEGEFAAASLLVPVNVAKAEAVMKVKRVKAEVQRGKVARVRIRVTADGVEPSGRVVMKIAGKSQSMRLNQAGEAMVNVRIPKRIKPGRKPVVITYRGDRYVVGEKARTTVRVKR